MNEILQSLKSDLLDRRLLPVVLLLAAALAGAIAYVVLAGGGSAKPVAAVVAAAPGAGGAPVKGPPLAVSEATANPHAAVAETTEGARYQHKSGSHNPFTPLPSPKLKTTTSSGSSSTTSSSPSSSAPETKSSPTTPSSGGGTTPAKPTPAKPKVVKKFVATISVLFGPAPTIPGQLSQLTPYAAVKPGEPLPNASNPLIVFKNIGSSRKSAIFTLNREAILKGGATCLPTASQCESIDLPIGQAEELSYLEPTGQTVTYELVLEGVKWREETATISRRHHHRHRHSHTHG
jgi:hypothetical protein